MLGVLKHTQAKLDALRRVNGRDYSKMGYEKNSLARDNVIWIPTMYLLKQLHIINQSLCTHIKPMNINLNQEMYMREDNILICMEYLAFHHALQMLP